MPEPVYDALDKGYTFWTKTIFCPSCKLRLNISLSTLGIPHSLVSTSCPFCGTWLVMEIQGSRQLGLYLQLAYLAAQPDKTRYTDDSPATSLSADESSTACATMAELLKNKGYLTTEDSSRINCLQWPRNLYWTRSCPKCHAPIRVNFTPIPHTAIRKDNTFTEAENRDFAQFLISCSGGGLIAQTLTCESQQCLAQIQVQLVRLEHGGCYMRRWYCGRGLGPETKRMPFGDSGDFNWLTTGRPGIGPQARDRNIFDFAKSLALSPSRQVSVAKEMSWPTFQEKILQALREGLWPQKERLLVPTWSIDMESCLFEALFHVGTPSDTFENGPSIREYVRYTFPFMHWAGNIKWKKTCPSKSCQAKLDVLYAPIPWPATELDQRLWSDKQKASVHHYMLRYHWDSYSPACWLERCPVCKVELSVELEPLGFGAYVLNDFDFKVAGVAARHPQRPIEFGDSGTYFNSLYISKSW